MADNTQIERDIRSSMEAMFPVGSHFGRAISPTGEPYIEVYTGQMVSEESAASVLLAKLNKYCEGKTGSLYWRIIPEVCFVNGIWAGYARLLISNRPTKWETDTDPSFLEAMEAYQGVTWTYNLAVGSSKMIPDMDDEESAAGVRKAEQMGIVINWNP